MKHGIIIPFYSEASVLNVGTLSELTGGVQDITICFVDYKQNKKQKDELQALQAGQLANSYFIHVDKDTRKEDAIKEATLFLFEETGVDTIGFIDPEHSKSFSDYQTLTNAYGKTSDRILCGLKKSEPFDKPYESHVFADFFFSVINGAGVLVDLFKKRKTRCVVKLFSRKVVPFVFMKDSLIDFLFDTDLISGKKFQLDK